jgi:hypothetical protein
MQQSSYSSREPVEASQAISMVAMSFRSRRVAVVRVQLFTDVASVCPCRLSVANDKKTAAASL